VAQLFSLGTKRAPIFGDGFEQDFGGAEAGGDAAIGLIGFGLSW
jgi:hypothetical protein